MPILCQTCGVTLAPDSLPAGLCPACLFAQALSNSPVDESGDPEPSGEELEPSGLAAGSSFGQFRIEGVLGKGGMSTVYRARETTLDRVVALKVLPPEFLHDETFARRFQQEARVVAALEHPHIVPLYANGIEDGIPWMSMRLLAGGDLRTLVDSGRQDVKRTVEILQAVASALDYAHARGVVHRDVKPSNILLDRAGHVCVSDFGLAHLFEKSLVQTRTGFIAGTPHYMAPEQGFGTGVDHRADIYSLGVVAYEMLTGRPPYDADSPVAVLMKHATEPFPVPADEIVPKALVPVLRKALAKEPNERWSTASEFASALERGIAMPLVASGMPVAVGIVGVVFALAVGVLFLRTPPPTDVAPEPAVDAMPAQGAPIEPATGLDLPSGSDVAPSVTGDDLSAAPSAVGQVDPVRPPARQQAPVPSGRDQIAPPVAPTPQPIAPASPPGLVIRADLEQPPAGRAVSGPEPDPDGSPAAGTDGPVTMPPVEETVTPPVRVREVSPAYPPLARAAQIEGDVLLQVVVGPDGSVTEVEVSRSVHPLLDDAAREAVLRYGYEPGLRGGAPGTFRLPGNRLVSPRVTATASPSTAPQSSGAMVYG